MNNRQRTGEAANVMAFLVVEYLCRLQLSVFIIVVLNASALGVK